MPTNRSRKKRTPKSQIPTNITPEFRHKLILKDYLGQLEDHEIPVAKANGLLRWDLYAKSKKVVTLTGNLHWQGYKLAPIHGKNYPKNQKFLVKSYEDLEREKGRDAQKA